MFVHVRTRVCMHVIICMHVCLCVVGRGTCTMVLCSPYYMYVCLYVCMYMYVCSRTDTCMYACDYNYVCKFVYVL